MAASFKILYIFDFDEVIHIVSSIYADADILADNVSNGFDIIPDGHLVYMRNPNVESFYILHNKGS